MASPPPAKKARPSIFQRFSMEPGAVDALKKHFYNLCSTQNWALVSLTIENCNAAYSSYGRSFSEADVDVRHNLGNGDVLFHFGSIFEEGVNMLESFFDNPETTPSDSRTAVILSKLLQYLLDQDQQKILKTGKVYECDLAVRYAVHLFSKLSMSPSYTLNKYYKYSISIEKCTCGCETNVAGCYGDTSIGNERVWHGCSDILFGSCLLPVSVVGENPDSPVGKSAVEVKVTDNLEDPSIGSQLMAQTIVFSFAEKKNHPEFKHFLIPSVGVNKTNIIFYFYDSEHDILLKSPSFQFLLDKREVNITCILATWFVLNHKFLCTGIPKENLNEVKKSNFFNLARNSLSVYENELSTGGDIRCSRSTPYIYQPSALPLCTFVKKSPKTKDDADSSKIEEAHSSQQNS